MGWVGVLETGVILPYLSFVSAPLTASELEIEGLNRPEPLDTTGTCSTIILEVNWRMNAWLIELVNLSD